MSCTLPIELVFEVLCMAAEALLLRDRPTVKNIALTAAFGYRAATPVFYRTLHVGMRNRKLVRCIFSDGKAVSYSAPCGGSGILCDPPARRLCPLVRQLFLDTNGDLQPEEIRTFVNLERFWSVEDYWFTTETFEALPPTVTHLGVMEPARFDFVVPSMTHISYFCGLRPTWDEHVLHSLLKLPSARAVTHIALDIDESVDGPTSCLDQLLSIVRMALAREETELLALHLLGDAARPESLNVLLEAMRQVVRSERDRRRFVVWNDFRPISSGVEDSKACLEDIILGRNVWTAGEPLEWDEEEETSSLNHQT